MNYTIIIPARYQASRLPGKLLLPLGDKTVLQHTYERALASGAQRVIIATDDTRIQENAASYGAEICMTATTHENGTQRLAEAATLLALAEDHIIVNVQGDEPLIPPSTIQQVAQNLQQQPHCMTTTLCEPMTNEDDINNPSMVKVVFNKHGHALYFSRAAIPYSGDNHCYRHIGLYAYRVENLKRYVAWPATPLERAENLEQLRLLWHGGQIHVAVAKETAPNGINTQEDYETICRQLDVMVPSP